MELAERMAGVVAEVIAETRPRLVQAAFSGERGERHNERHADNFLSIHDMWLHQRYRELLSASLESFVYASEEDDPVVIGPDPDPDLCVLVDPLDTSELAVRGLNGYTHVVVYSRARARPIAAVVGDIYHHMQLYVASESEAYVVTSDSHRHPMGSRLATALPDALITNYFMRPAERFRPLADQERLLNALSGKGRIGVDFGSVGLCHVASGFTEAMVEFAKGFAIWDLMPGHYILHTAGGIVVDLNGDPLPLDYGLGSLDDIAKAMSGRRKFVAAGNEQLARQLVTLLTD